MAIQHLNAKFAGTRPLLINNPQMADPLNEYKKAHAALTKKGVRRTEEDYAEIGRIEIKAKLYFDDTHGVYIPERWVTAALCQVSFTTIKVAKAKIRSSVFLAQDKVPLNYRNKDRVKTVADIVGNPEFQHKMLLPQNGVRVPKHCPIFHDWSFAFDLDYDDTVVDFDDVKVLLHQAANYGGFGDFRPTFGRCTVEVTRD